MPSHMKFWIIQVGFQLKVLEPTWQKSFSTRCKIMIFPFLNHLNTICFHNVQMYQLLPKNSLINGCSYQEDAYFFTKSLQLCSLMSYMIIEIFSLHKKLNNNMTFVWNCWKIWTYYNPNYFCNPHFPKNKPKF